MDGASFCEASSEDQTMSQLPDSLFYEDNEVKEMMTAVRTLADQYDDRDYYYYDGQQPVDDVEGSSEEDGDEQVDGFWSKEEYAVLQAHLEIEEYTDEEVLFVFQRLSSMTAPRTAASTLHSPQAPISSLPLPASPLSPTGNSAHSI